MLTVLKFNHAQFICVQVHGSLKMVVYVFFSGADG